MSEKKLLPIFSVGFLRFSQETVDAEHVHSGIAQITFTPSPLQFEEGNPFFRRKKQCFSAYYRTKYHLYRLSRQLCMKLAWLAAKDLTPSKKGRPACR